MKISTTQLLKRIPSLILIFIAVEGCVFSIKSASHPDISTFLYRQITLLLALLVVACYLVYSLFRSDLLRLNNIILYLVVTSSILLELVLRVSPNLIPIHFLIYLPPEDRKKLAEERGLPVYDTRVGEGMIYHYKPYQKIKARPYIQIDNLGYRNPSNKVDNYVDIVLLGDSMILAENSENDLGELFRKKGYSALNLAMGGYAPQHYRDVYKKFIIEKNIKNAYTLVFLFIGNDFSDALNYENVLNKGGNWEHYVKRVPTHSYQEYLPWLVNIVVIGLPDYFRGRLINPSHVVKLPYQSIKVNYLWWPPKISKDDPRWQLVQEALEELIQLSRYNSATPMIFLLPSPATLYSPYDEELKKWDDNYNVTSKTIEEFARDQEVQFIDLNTPLRNEISKDFILAADWDCHLNTLGVSKLFEIVFQYIKVNQMTKYSLDTPLKL